MPGTETPKCRNCGSAINPFFSLGDMPLVNNFRKTEEISNEKRFDLTVGFCPDCYLVQLLKTVPPENLFRHYLYFSSTSSSFLEHCKKQATYLTGRLGLTSEDLVLEIASNDGAFLKCFKELGIKTLGIDPAENIAKVANEAGIKTIPDFFNDSLAHNLKSEGLEAGLVFGANVLAHVPGIKDFVKGVKTILSPKGTAVFEFPYIEGLMENKFDTIYHEHVFYFSLLALRNIFQGVGLEIYDVEKTPMQGGSLMIFVSRPGVFTITDNVNELINYETKNGFKNISAYKKINDNVVELKNKLIGFLENLKAEGKSVAAYGAAAKGIVLMNYFGISGYLNFIADKSPAKQGLYAPGTGLLVGSPQKVYDDKTDYLLILPWNISDEIREQFKDFQRAGGKFIIPVPEIKII